MKIRTGFVSNSSSSSFCIQKKHLSELQLLAIREHVKFAEMLDIPCEAEDQWTITDISEGKGIEGYAFMDNYDMSTFLAKIGVKSKHIHWEYM